MVVAAERQVVHTLIEIENVHGVGKPLLSFRHKVPKQSRVVLVRLSTWGTRLGIVIVIVDVKYRLDKLMFPVGSGRPIGLQKAVIAMTAPSGAAPHLPLFLLDRLVMNGQMG